MKIPFTNFEISKRTSKSVSYGVKQKLEMQKSSLLFDKRISSQSLFDVYRTNSDVRATIDILGNYVGRDGWILKDKNGEKIEEKNKVYVEAWNILNSLQSFHFLTKRIVRDMRVPGNAFVEKVKSENGKIVGLKPIDPRTMSIVATKSGTVLRYVQKVSGEVVIFEPLDILHFFEESDITNEAFGMGRLESLFVEAMADVKSGNVALNWFENDATPSTYLILNEEIFSSEESIKQLEDKLKYEFSGDSNKGKTALIPFLKDIKTVSPTLKDIASRQFSTEKICSGIGVPKFFLGITDTVNNNNAIELKTALYEGAVNPIEKIIADLLTRELFYSFEEIDEFCFNEQDFRQAEKEQRALEEYTLGILTLRQYKIKTGQEITPEDEKNPNIDTHLIIKIPEQQKEEPKN